MREYLKIIAGGLIVALAVVPAFAQTGSRPQSTQQAPRNQSETSGSTSTDSSGMSNQGTNQTTTPDSSQDSQTRSKMRDSSTGSGTTGSGMSRDSATGTNGTMSRDSATGTMSSDSMRGMRGAKASKADVRQVQEALKAQGHDPGPIDGAMGPQTQEALRAYQRSQSVTETGQLDQQTADKLGVRGGTSQRPSR